MHVPCTCSGDPRSALIQCRDALLIVYRCTEFGVASSKFHRLERSHVYNLFSFCTCCLCRLTLVRTMARVLPYCRYQLTKFEPCPSFLSSCTLELIKGVRITCMCPPRAMCTTGQLFIQHRYISVLLYQCAAFSVNSSKIHKLGGSYIHKVSPHWHVLLLAPRIGNHNGTCPPMVDIGQQNLGHFHPLTWSAALTN